MHSTAGWPPHRYSPSTAEGAAAGEARGEDGGALADRGARVLQCCKAGSIAQTLVTASCQATRGNTDCSAPLAGSSTHRSGCTEGFGGPLATGRGCRKAGSITQASEAVSFQATPGNTDRSAYLAGSTTSYPDQCGCTAGFGGSLTTGRGCRKVDSIPRASEAALQDTRGNTDCSASTVGSCAGQIGCTAGFGGSPTTGRRCGKAGSIAQTSTAASCQATRGNTDCSAASPGTPASAQFSAAARRASAGR